MFVFVVTSKFPLLLLFNGFYYGCICYEYCPDVLMLIKQG